jgi:hypothetical protein
MRYTVVGLIFATFLIAGLIGCFGIAAKWGVLVTAMALMTSVVTLQLSYFVGCFFGRWCDSRSRRLKTRWIRYYQA